MLNDRHHVRIAEISKPFNCGATVELTLKLAFEFPVEGEMHLRVPTNDASKYNVGDMFCFKLTRVE